MRKHSLRRQNSGQILVITSLIVTLLLLSTTIYVIDTERNSPVYEQTSGNPFFQYRQSIENALVSALANITNGGQTSILTTNLDSLKEAIIAYSYSAIVRMDFTPLNSAPYQDGILVSWGTSGQGISSAYVSYLLDSSSFSTTSSLAHSTNVTTNVNLSGQYYRLEGNLKQVNLVINVFNEGKPALAQNFTFYFELDGLLAQENWIQVNSTTTSNYGNGTYAVSFIAETNQRNDPLLVSMLCQDQRSILVRANVTCTLIGG